MTTNRTAQTDLLVIGSYLDEIHDALVDNASTFTCSEADAIAVIYSIVCRDDDACSFLLAHADGDEDIEGDRHIGITCPDDARQYLSDLLDA